MGTLKCVCWKCSKLLIEKLVENLKDKNSNKFIQICQSMFKVDRCGDENSNGCGAPKPTSIKR